MEIKVEHAFIIDEKTSSSARIVMEIVNYFFFGKVTFGPSCILFSISFQVFDCIRLTKKETTSLSRLFLKNLFFGLFKYFGFIRLNRCLNDP
jgi:hypothetical protein